jgi:hypothetical protein
MEDVHSCLIADGIGQQRPRPPPARRVVTLFVHSALKTVRRRDDERTASGTKMHSLRSRGRPTLLASRYLAEVKVQQPARPLAPVGAAVVVGGHRIDMPVRHP